MIGLEDLLVLFSKRIKRDRHKQLYVDDVLWEFKHMIDKNFRLKYHRFIGYSRRDVLLWIANTVTQSRPKYTDDGYVWEGWTFKRAGVTKKEIVDIFIQNVLVKDAFCVLSKKELYDVYTKWWRINVKGSVVSKKAFIAYVTKVYFKKRPAKHNYFSGWMGYTCSDSLGGTGGGEGKSGYTN